MQSCRRAGLCYVNEQAVASGSQFASARMPRNTFSMNVAEKPVRMPVSVCLK